MGKYGIGARVIDDGGDAGLIVAKRKGERLIRYDDKDYGELWWTKDGLTPANDNPSISPEISVKEYNAAPAKENTHWVPKVGDRVRVVKHCNYQGKAIPLKAQIGSEHTVTRVTNVLEDEGVPTFELSEGGHNFYTTLNLEPVVAPASTALTIEAGKSYRTRDGRKVGPMVFYPYDERLPWASGDFGDPRAWQADGRRYLSANSPSDDLVAEWVETAEVAVAEPQPKFKAGDKVRCIDSSMSGGFKAGEAYEIRSASNGRVSIVRNSHGSGTDGWGDEHFELIEPTQPERKFKVGDVVNYIDGKSQDIWQGVTITKDTGDSYYATCPKSGDGAFKEDWLTLATPLATPPAKFKIGDRVDLYRDGEPVEPWRNMTITQVALAGVFEFNTDVGLLCNAHELRLSTNTFPIGSTVTFTATGRLSAINENGHHQVTFPGLPSGQNSFALPAAFVTLAN